MFNSTQTMILTSPGANRPGYKISRTEALRPRIAGTVTEITGDNMKRRGFELGTSKKAANETVSEPRAHPNI